MPDPSTRPEPPAPSPPSARPGASSRLLWGAIAILVIAVVVFLAIKLGGGGSTDVSPKPSPTEGPLPGISFRFDALGGGSKVIDVYPGVSDSPKDKVSSGTERDGETLPAICKTEGRLIKSDPGQGERENQSTTWVKVRLNADTSAFATLTYGDMSKSDLDALPACA